MAYKLIFQAQISWVGPGAGPMETLLQSSGNFQMGGGGAQSKGFTTNPASIPIANGAGAGGTLTGGDVTNLTNAVAADLAAQINLAANLGVINGWPGGNP
jgi:hypothetical protein